MALKVKISCEIDDLIREVATHTGKTYKECEDQAFKSQIYPEGSNTILSIKGYLLDVCWFRQAAYEIMQRDGIDRLLVVNAI